MRVASTVIAAAIFAAAIAGASPAQAQGTRTDYERAARLYKFDELVSRLSLGPNWIDRTSRFWYADRQDGRTNFLVVDPATNDVAPAFDHARLAKALSGATGKSFTAEKLPFDKFAFVANGSAILVTVEKAGWRCTLADYVCKPAAAPFREGDVLSPDRTRAVFVRDDNLWLRDVESGDERALTSDGRPGDSYASSTLGDYVTRSMLGRPVLPHVEFSADSSKLLAWRTDVSKVRQMSVLETVPGGVPRVHSFPFTIPGDAELPKTTQTVVDLARGTALAVAVPPIEQLSMYGTFGVWSADARRVGFSENSRDYKSLKLHLVDATTGAVTTAKIDSADTYVDYGYAPKFLGDDLVALSERDGWRHLYRIDPGSGRVRAQLTKGPWVVRAIVHTDEAEGYVYFTAGGREPGRDPYLRALYRVRIDGTGLELLTPEDGDHDIAFAPDGKAFVDTWSRIDVPPVTNLRAADGRLIRELQRADTTKLVAAGWSKPEPFSVKAADGKTDLYGNIFRPSNFDAAKRYPVLEHIYPGPQAIRTQKNFASGYGPPEEYALAELGFIVVTLDGRGGPHRSKAFHNYSYGNLQSAGALEDHVAGLKQLAARYPQFDLDRVGIYGHSGGGYASTRALLDYPDFYKVAVSSAGNHDQRGYFSEWGERYQGYPSGDNYLAQANAARAGNLKGKLLLVHGSMDDNVSPDLTLQVANALIEADVNFDMLLLPNRNHGMTDLAKGKKAGPSMDPYFVRRRWDYFVQHLLGVTPPADFHLTTKKPS